MDECKKHSSQVFDKKDLLKRLLGDREMVVEIIKAFLDDMPGQIAALRTYVENGRADKATAQAHKIKGAAANIAARALQDAAYDMETAAGTGDMETLNALMPELEARYSRLKKIIESGR
jgi:HPt (histidine-containing phosphotransfer) domain-containing protein